VLAAGWNVPHSEIGKAFLLLPEAKIAPIQPVGYTRLLGCPYHGKQRSCHFMALV
jgi:hypothetical protein